MAILSQCLASLLAVNVATGHVLPTRCRRTVASCDTYRWQ